MSTYGARHYNSQATFSTPASSACIIHILCFWEANVHPATLFRRLTWEGTVPLEVRVDSKELPANSDRGLECYYVQAPRVSYLPLLMPEIRRFLMDVVFDEAAAEILKEDEWWFESEDGIPMKWYDPCIYFLYRILR